MTIFEYTETIKVEIAVVASILLIYYFGNKPNFKLNVAGQVVSVTGAWYLDMIAELILPDLDDIDVEDM